MIGHLSHIIRAFVRKLWDVFDLYVFCLYRKDVYMRKRGVRIGFGCDLITDVVNFGSEPYLIQIGNCVTVTSGVKFINHDASTRLFRDRFPEMNKYGNVFAPITIGSNSFIGVNAILLPGTKLGDNTIVGAGSIVKGEFPGNSVIAGVPARRLYSVDEFIEKVQNNMVLLQATNRDELKKELTQHFFGQEGSM
jgi:acetyltransferase-like isoleucine patch superfamily enzyme